MTLKTLSKVLIGLALFAVVLSSWLDSDDKTKSYNLHAQYLFGDIQNEYETVHAGIVRLDHRCTAWVVDKHYAITAAHCFSDTEVDSGMTFPIYDNTGQDLNIKVKVFGLRRDSDLAVLSGDFQTIHPILAEFNNSWFLNAKPDDYVICGYPRAQNHLTCSPFVFAGMSDFSIFGYSHIAPGFSGGPLINVSTQTAVGVVVSVGDNKTFVSPILGLLGMFHLE